MTERRENRAYLAGKEHVCKFGKPTRGNNNDIIRRCVYWFCNNYVVVDDIPDEIY